VAVALDFEPSIETRRPATGPCPVRSGHYGIAWDWMDVNGLLTYFGGPIWLQGLVHRRFSGAVPRQRWRIGALC